VVEREPEHDACGVGFLADLSTRPSRDLVALALRAVAGMAHRGARAADGKSGDGAGILLETPRALFARDLEANGLRVDHETLAGIGVFLPQHEPRAKAIRIAVERAAASIGLRGLWWRTPPVRSQALGPIARESEPTYQQLIVDAGAGDRASRMRHAYAAVERAIAAFEDGAAALVSASASSIVYKALLSSDELTHYFADLDDAEFVSRFAVFHQRFSTNTSASWRMVQPFRHVAHNGEFNTISGNRAWLRARGIAVTPGASDSHDFNTALEALLDAGYRVDDAIDLLLGAAVDAQDDRLRAYYDAHLPTIEHWDGPAAIAFYHAGLVGAALDRSGFRPLRWCRTADGKILVASEAGVVDFGDDRIVERGRLGPGERLAVDLATGTIVKPDEFRRIRREREDYRATVQAWSFHDAPTLPDRSEEASPADLRRFAFSHDDLKDVVAVMASGAGEPVSSMGDDAAPAFLSGGEPAAHYFRQRFAQVTNPAIDPLREAFVFDMRAFVGCGGIRGELASPLSAVMLESAIVSEATFDALCDDERLERHDVALVLDERSLELRLREILDDVLQAVRSGATLVVLDNRSPGAAIPAVLAAGAVHQRLVAAGLRMQSSIVVADGYARDAHSIATVLGAGANVVTPWLALRCARASGSEDAFLNAVRGGLLKIMAKLGICTLRSYVGAQTFESLGLAREVVEMCMPAAIAHVPAIGFRDLEHDVRGFYAQAGQSDGQLPDRGRFRYRRDGVRHAFDPRVIKELRASAMHGDYGAFERLSDAMDGREPVVVRDLLETRPAGQPIALEAVDDARAIASTFATAAMSHGALGAEAHETVARAANLAGARSNSGEGGESRARFDRSNPARTAIKQIASARFGVSVSYLESADEVEIKIAQGSKPGEGGQIPGNKVTAEIAELRGALPGQALISPPPHHDIYSIEDLAQLMFDLRRAAPHARIAVKLVAQGGIGQVAVGVVKAGADIVHVSGHDGGTGASPLGSIKHCGLPWELGIADVHDALMRNGLRSRVQLRADGGLKNGRDVIIASMLGADLFAFGSGLLVALGCIYARQCHKNTCPVGIASQDEVFRKKFAGTPEQGAAYLEFVARDVRRRLAGLGARSLRDIRGRRELLAARALDDARLSAIDLSQMLRAAPAEPHFARILASPANVDDVWESRDASEIVTLGPGDRAVGARVAHDFAHRRAAGFATPPVRLAFRGTAGQSFGAFLTSGITLDLDGDANDYVGKSMEGGTIVVRGCGNPSEPAVGNTCFYGARGGEAYVHGAAGERFAVRNSGATLVVESAGDHACEYMTAGVVVVLGKAGRNVASGMSGGIAFFLRDGEQRPHTGPTALELSPCDASGEEAGTLRRALEAHTRYTGSAKARELLATWPQSIERFWQLSASAPRNALV
jgi:glutamate synthase domain-containing protein 2/glutamate synthase domain-containing protein 1/glutamate synthase domain-containing protein 3